MYNKINPDKTHKGALSKIIIQNFFEERGVQMKKIALSIAAIVMALTCVFSLSACGQTPEEKLANYIESDTFKEQVDSMSSQFESVLDVDVKAEDSKIIYEFTYKTQIPDNTLDTVKSSLDSAFQSMASTYEGIANTIKKEVGVENPVIVVNINNADGKNITTMEFNATE